MVFKGLQGDWWGLDKTNWQSELKSHFCPLSQSYISTRISLNFHFSTEYKQHNSIVNGFQQIRMETIEINLDSRPDIVDLESRYKGTQLVDETEGIQES